MLRQSTKRRMHILIYRAGKENEENIYEVRVGKVYICICTCLPAGHMAHFLYKLNNHFVTLTCRRPVAPNSPTPTLAKHNS